MIRKKGFKKMSPDNKGIWIDSYVQVVFVAVFCNLYCCSDKCK